MQKFPGGLTARVTPVPIPNTEVKPCRADDTALETTRERRSPPGLRSKNGSEQSGPFLFGGADSAQGARTFAAFWFAPWVFRHSPGFDRLARRSHEYRIVVAWPSRVHPRNKRVLAVGKLEARPAPEKANLQSLGLGTTHESPEARSPPQEVPPAPARAIGKGRAAMVHLRYRKRLPLCTGKTFIAPSP
jgi:hypothetical protein